MRGIDVFGGAGGMSLGATLAGVDVRIAIDSDKYASITYAKNHTCTDVINEDIRCINTPPPIGTGAPTILFGGPPCQGFSTSNQRTRSTANPNNWLYQEFFRMVEYYAPDWVVFENVKGIMETSAGMFLKKIEGRFHSLGYFPCSFLLNAEEFGVPQKRSRFFIVGAKREIGFRPPKGRQTRPVTVHDAIFDLPCLSPGASFDRLPYSRESDSAYAKMMRGSVSASTGHLVSRNSPAVIERYKHIPQGGNWQDIPARLMANYTDVSRCHTGIYKRLKSDEPSVVIGNYRKNMLIHPTSDRGLSVREAARLQSFPDHYEFMGSIGFQQQQVGNAVPPLLAKAVFERIVETARARC